MRRILALLSLLVSTSIAGAQATTAPAPGAGRVIGEDYFFNHQVRNGKQFHYIWDDATINGYSKFGAVWKQYGATLASLPTSPTRADLDHFSVYVIVNPSTVKNAADHQPNFMTSDAADVIAGWVHDGGVLAMFANDKNNCEIPHFNILSQRFGITFNNDLRNEVPSARDRKPGCFDVSTYQDQPLFNGVTQFYVKEICTLEVKDPAQALLVADNEQHTGKDIIIATAHYGKGFVFAIGDPWVYNEYIDVKSTPGTNIQNRKAAENLVQWLLSQSSLPAAK
jgi:unsaturated rhamnogalacturonyl hydrolase